LDDGNYLEKRPVMERGGRTHAEQAEPEFKWLRDIPFPFMYIRMSIGFPDGDVIFAGKELLYKMVAVGANDS
jgi:hypothetical protein